MNRVKEDVSKLLKQQTMVIGMVSNESAPGIIHKCFDLILYQENNNNIVQNDQ